MNRITFIPVGGLANRMRTIASAVHLSKETKSRLNVFWFQDWALSAPFFCLFKPIDEQELNLKEASSLDSLWIDRPRRKNLFLPRLYQSLAFEDCIYEQSFYSRVQNNFDFSGWINKKKNVYMASYSAFQSYDSSLISHLFAPVDFLKNRIDDQCAQFSEYVVGVHIRRTDNIASIKQSPLGLFYNKLDTEVDIHSRTTIYLATDSEEVKALIKQRYGKRVVCLKNPASRNSVEGIQEGIIDMYTLAMTHKIYGSWGSSFSEMAAQISGAPLEILKLKL